nr:choice-of-anchor Q domain-containing protein [uncultured Desulfobacter sp.]
MIESSSDCQAPLGLNGHGGGIYYRYNGFDDIEGSAIFENTIISGNSTYIYGGGIYLNMSTPHSCLITGCTLSSNQASQGGGLYGGDENTLVYNTIFENNYATGYGGGGINKSNSVFMDCKIRNNTSDGGGGGLYSSWAGSNPQLINCEFSGNIAYGYTGGGGICLNNCASPKIMGCEFYNNSAMDGKGGGISLHYHAYSDEEKRGEIINCIFADNYASEEGGAILFETYCSTEIPFYFINNTITQNSGFDSGGIYSSSELSVQNSIVYYNSPNDIIGDNGLTTISYCNTTELMEGEGNMSELPEFIGNGDFHLSWNSPCIDRGTMLNAPDSDIDGDKRPEGEGIDIGADEFVDSDSQETIIILTDASPNATVEADSIAKIYGTNGANNIIVGSGADVELINFPGENSIIIQSQSSFSAYRTGAMIILDGSDGTKIKLPATMTQQSIIINDVEKILAIDSGCIMINDQIVNLDSVAIE